MNIPDFDIHDDTLLERYTAELKKVETLDDLIEHTKRWSAFWEADHVDKHELVRIVDHVILQGDLTDEDLRCVKLSFEERVPDEYGVPCEHMTGVPPEDGIGPPETGYLCPGMEIRMPWSTLTALGVARHYMVPISVAFHQLFCRDEWHCNCF
jgi:hypothetical protein